MAQDDLSVRKKRDLKALPSFLSVALIYFLSLFLCQLQSHPPKPLSLGVDKKLFSAGRAYKTLQGLIGDDRPHQVGSKAQRSLGDKIIKAFKERYGITPTELRKSENA